MNTIILEEEGFFSQILEWN